MRTTIDAAGRIVVPKAIRDELGLLGGEEVEVSVRDGRVEIEPVSVPMHLIERDGVVVAEPESALPRLTAEEVRDALGRIRR
jgi:AbrB family looped-hinge helix DNA binding protein